MRRRPAPGPAALAALVAGVVVVLVVAVVLWWPGGDESRLERAVHLAPADTERLSWTDWSAVRREVGADLGDSPDGAAVAAFLDGAFASDLTSTSALVGSSGTLQDAFGFSPGTLDWELFAQSPDGAVDILGMGDEDGVDALADRLRDLGFEEPDDDDGVWGGGQDLLPRIGPDLTPELQYVALLADEGVVLTSDQAPYLGGRRRGRPRGRRHGVLGRRRRGRRRRAGGGQRVHRGLHLPPPGDGVRPTPTTRRWPTRWCSRPARCTR